MTVSMACGFRVLALVAAVFFVVSSTKLPDLPAGWERATDPESGKTYYANRATGESSWNPPAVPRPVYEPHQPDAPQLVFRSDDRRNTSRLIMTAPGKLALRNADLEVNDRGVASSLDELNELQNELFERQERLNRTLTASHDAILAQIETHANESVLLREQFEDDLAVLENVLVSMFETSLDMNVSALKQNIAQNKRLIQNNSQSIAYMAQVDQNHSAVYDTLRNEILEQEAALHARWSNWTTSHEGTKINIDTNQDVAIDQAALFWNVSRVELEKLHDKYAELTLEDQSLHDYLEQVFGKLKQDREKTVAHLLMLTDAADADIDYRIENNTQRLEGIKNITATKACRTGKYRDPGLPYGCLNCTAGHYQDQPGQTSCKTCTTATLPGQSVCTS